MVILVYMRSKWIFEPGSRAGMLLFILMITTILTFIFSIASLPRWQSFIGLIISLITAYYILFEPSYAIP